MAPGYPYIVKREPGPQTVTGAGDIVTDNCGQRYRVIDSAEANMLRNSTAGQVFTIGSDGTIR
jgi:hypothetical protein